MSQKLKRSIITITKKINPCNFNKRDYMYLLKQSQKGKLDNQYLGSYLIINKIGNHNVKLATGKKRIKIVYEDKLKKAQYLTRRRICISGNFRRNHRNTSPS